MKTTATVISVTGERATVAVERSSACASCPSRAGCASCGQTRKAVAYATNEIGARPGDKVGLYTPTKHITALAMLTFFVPVALPLAGFAAVAPVFGEPAGYVAMALLLVLSVCGSVAVDRLYLRGRTAARITKILDNKKIDIE